MMIIWWNHEPQSGIHMRVTISVHDTYVKGGARETIDVVKTSCSKEMKPGDEAYRERKRVRVNRSGVGPGRVGPLLEVWMHPLPFSLDYRA
jgi:hypothetical protein